jgi:RNA polymerase sigma-70 factor (ECF subfamily)
MRPLYDAELLTRISSIAHTRRASLAALARAEGVTPDDAVDCVQEGFCTLLGMARCGELTDDEGWGAALAVIVRNAARNRRRRHDRARPHDDLAERPCADDSPTADEILVRAEDHVRLRVCVAELCATQRAVVTLRVLEEQPGEDVARALGISPGHVAVLLHRARRALRECMTEPTG